MARDWQLWGVTLRVEKHHGENARRWIGEQIARLTISNDNDGVAKCSVAERLEAQQGDDAECQ